MAAEMAAQVAARLAEHDAALRQVREQQTATADILKVISQSPTDAQQCSWRLPAAPIA